MSLSQVAACPLASLEDLTKDTQPIRETHSSPFISNKKMDKQLTIDENIFTKMTGVQFDAGCSSSSTDLDKLIEFYNKHNDEETLSQWMNIYEEQKLANSIANANNSLAKYKKKEICDSVDDLLHQSPKKVSINGDILSKDAPFNRSMDIPMIEKEIDQKFGGFFALSKCQSADFQSKYDMPRTRLLRSKEMPNIADVDDDSEY